MSEPSRGAPHGDARRAVRGAWPPCALLVGFIGLAVVSYRAKGGIALDHEVLGWLVEHRRGGITTAAIIITNAGSPAAMVLLAVAASVTLWRRRSPRTAVVVVATLALAYAMSTLTKTLVGAHRPPRAVQLVLALDQSYPSGHVTGTLALLGIVAVVCGRGRSRLIQAALAVGVGTATLVVALTRLYLGVHWLIDVVGGCLLGSAAVLVGSSVLGRVATAHPGSLGHADTPAPTTSQVG
ncbi:phosphatase PAP2 family protein [Mycolicibacterium sp.]|uniref:phosphatase PAP2 family protein n=1 Tax=Mycolicibacterium sp. TaxID=2320850 RepID=UPI001A230517|nr:phosphatase PAP2 family protein [Mycolicibacterium sp.]MBJ7340385.1 phosphatase PAP2 family protein [Mycolicibacterium sp.]